jgi:hypothetical protein
VRAVVVNVVFSMPMPIFIRSDALFVMARTVSALLGQEEATYQPCRQHAA